MENGQLQNRPRIIEIPLLKGDTGIKKILRHLKQLHLVLFSSQYKSYAAQLTEVDNSYSCKTEEKFWKDIAEYGLEDFEIKAISDCQLPASKLNTLMIGCGAGREPFGLENLGHNVVATDINQDLIMIAKELAKKRNSTVKFIHGSYSPIENEVKKFDLIFTTNLLLNLIPGRTNRVNFLIDLHNFCTPESRVILFTDVLKLSPKNRLFWISKLLWLKKIFGLGEFEKGDIVSSSIGNYSGSYHPTTFHYYPYNKSLEDELKEAGFSGENKWGIFWLVKPIS